MKKCIFIWVLSLILSIGLGCAATPQIPKEGIISSTNTPDTGTSDDRYQALIGEWRGSLQYAFRGTWFPMILIIHEIDIGNAKARCTFSVYTDGPGRMGFLGLNRSMDNPVQADFIPGPNPKIKWEIRSGQAGQGQYEFVLKGKVLEGTISGWDYLWTEGFVEFYKFPPSPRTFKMEKQLKK